MFTATADWLDKHSFFSDRLPTSSCASTWSAWLTSNWLLKPDILQGTRKPEHWQLFLDNNGLGSSGWELNNSYKSLEFTKVGINLVLAAVLVAQSIEYSYFGNSFDMG